ncbi:hypothetical protein F2Q70_00006178 [Brassica cretica]|uniref:Translocon-associated protein subunit beta n=1 Tax=Brassica cretica TaxID=69181 RepID=A0A8S9ITL3_BRACR|nr:hypothetical protein F2Q70_00006178 [Brassica cretica]
MAIPLAKLLISAVAVFMLVSASFATSEMPFMVVHKKATLNRLKSGAERVLVSFDIYNQGSASVLSLNPLDLICFRFQSVLYPNRLAAVELSLDLLTAYDVTLVDNTWIKKTFEVVNGNTSRSWERLDA